MEIREGRRNKGEKENKRMGMKCEGRDRGLGRKGLDEEGRCWIGLRCFWAAESFATPLDAIINRFAQMSPCSAKNTHLSSL
jgi:hypothetical protein